jgi:hypothetical protein
MGWRSEPHTLESLGKKYNLTREGVRQIENKAIKKLSWWRDAETLKPLQDAIAKILADSSAMHLASFSDQLRQQFGWWRALHANAITKILPAILDTKIVDGQYVCASECKTPWNSLGLPQNGHGR